MKKKGFLAFFLMGALACQLLCLPAQGLEDPEIRAGAALLVDVKTDAPAYEKNAHHPMYPASLTKVMTALVLLERLSGNTQLLDETPVTAEASAFSDPLYYDPAGSTANIKVGETMTVRQLMQCMLIVSANEACNILAQWHSGSVAAFVEEMNEKAAELGLENTHFVNPSGLHHEQHVSTAWDLYRITKAAMAYPEFMELCDTANVKIPATNMSKQRDLWTTNHLLATWRVVGYRNREAHGIKTGSTSAAKYCLISSARKGEIEFVSVILGAERIEENGKGNILSFSETTRLLDYGLNNFSYRTILKTQELIGEVPVTLSKTDYVTVYPAEEIEVLFPLDLDPADLERVVTLPEEIQAPVSAGTKLGTLELRYAEHSYAQVDLLASSDVEADRLLVLRHQALGYLSRPEVKAAAAAAAVLLLALAVWRLMRPAARSRYGRGSRGRRRGYRGRRR